MRVRFVAEALLAVREKRAWWAQHREKAPDLFVQELAAVVAKLREGADQERQEYAARSGRIVWRVLMPKTKQHVYYRRDRAGDIEILTVWNAAASAGPSF